MTSITTHLTFNGNCREAMTFYQACLGGELRLQTVGQYAFGLLMPPRWRKYILHGTLINDTLVLSGSDMAPETGLITGNNVSLFLRCRSEEEARSYYTRLSSDGRPTHPLEDTFWGALFGDLVDRFGNQWLIHFQKS